MSQHKVFVASLHRNGTRSLHELLQKFGLRSIHHPSQLSKDLVTRAGTLATDFDRVFDLIAPLFDQYDAFSDTPFNIFFRQQAALFPDAQFIAVHRDPAKWIESVRRHCGGRKFGPFERTQYAFLTSQRPSSIDELSDAELKENYTRYYAELRVFFEQAPGRLLLADLSDPELPALTAHFLAIGIADDLAMPHISD